MKKAPRFVFFTGKGCVGKTSISCMLSGALADQGEKVLLWIVELRYTREVHAIGKGRVVVVPWIPSVKDKSIIPV